MAEKRSLGFGWRLIGVVAAGLLLAACFPPYNLPFLMPFALAMLLYLLDGVTVRQGFYLGAAFGYTFFMATLFWMTRVFQTAAISLWAIAALFPMLFAMLLAHTRPRLPRLPLWLLAAVTWTGLEYFRSELMRPNFGWMGLGYAVVNVPILASVVSVFGSYGLSFALMALGALLLPGEGKKAGWRMRAGILVSLWLACFLVPRSAPAPSRALDVRLVQAGGAEDDSLLPLSRLTPGTHTDIIVWPEYSEVLDPMRLPALHRQLTDLARKEHVYLLLGAKDEFGLGPNDYYNTAFLFGPDGTLLGKHVKNHLVHFVTDGIPGKESVALPTPLGRLGVAICFDMDFPDVARRLADDGAEVFLVPNNDPRPWGPVQHAQHRLMFQMRAVECGRWLARADVAGGTSVVAPNGQQVQGVTTTEPVALDAKVGRESGRTLFVRGGWCFGQACLLALIVGGIASLWKGAGSSNPRKRSA